uniref:Casein kinase II subunit beta n=2 Tax=Macrostomum lignano TaxID=282301 RepID=A0A1I8IVK3_9PLAT
MRMVDSDSPASAAANWIAEFCDRPGNEFFCKVDEDYIRDRFNLTGLGTAVPNYHRAMKLLLDGPEQLDLASDDPQLETLQRSAELLYGLIHVRFIMSVQGMPQMVAKWMLGHFGVCRRVFCEKQRVLPVGLSDIPGEATVKVYCPRCMEVYVPNSSRHLHVDGAYFGTGFPHLLFLSHPECRPKPPANQFAPSLYGFKIHPLAYQLQQAAAAGAQRQHRDSGIGTSGNPGSTAVTAGAAAAAACPAFKP